MNTQKKGFTLIELLIVIGIIGILAAAVIVVLNPAELLAQARDGTRLSDVDSTNSAINLYIASVDGFDLHEGGTGATGTVSVATANCPFVTTTCNDVTSVLTDGTGWVRVNLNASAGGSPIPVLPTDPTNNITYYYAFASSDVSNTFEVNARLESERHRDKMDNDGGDKNGCATNGYTDNTCYYEKGTEPGLDF